MHGKLAGYKTYVVCLLAILTAWGAYLTGDYEFQSAVEASFAALAAAAMRGGIAKAAGTAAVKKPYGFGSVMILACCIPAMLVLPSCSNSGGVWTGGGTGVLHPATVETAAYFAGVKYLDKAKTEKEWTERKEQMALLVSVMSVVNDGITAEALREVLRRRFQDKPEVVLLGEVVIGMAADAGAPVETRGLRNDYLRAGLAGLNSALDAPEPDWGRKG